VWCLAAESVGRDLLERRGRPYVPSWYVCDCRGALVQGRGGAHGEIYQLARGAQGGKAARARSRPPVRTRAAAPVRGSGTLAWRSGHGTRDWNLGVLRVPKLSSSAPPNRKHGVAGSIASGEPAWLPRGLEQYSTGGHALTSRDRVAPSEGICMRVVRPWRAPTGSAEIS